MPRRSIVSEHERQMALKWIASMELPFILGVTKGRRRSIEQNKLQMQMIREIAEQLGDRTVEEVRGECKLTHGVPILRAENEAFREAYDRVVKPLPYEAKVKIMMEPLDMPVTRLMTVGQKTQYLDAVARHYAEQGVIFGGY